MRRIETTKPPSAKGGPGNLSSIGVGDSTENASKAHVAQARIELIRDDIAATVSALQAALDCALAMHAAQDDCGLTYALRRAAAYWQSVSSSAKELAAIEGERQSVIRQGRAT